MSTPLTADELLRALRSKGLRVVEHRSWRTHNRNHKGPFGPVHGVMLHHTVSSGTKSSVELCYNGHSALPGPLCHGVIDKAGTIHLVGNGRANHAGSGDGDVLRAVIDERELPPDNEANTDGNRHFYGFEAINLGDGNDPWPAAQIDAMAKAAAAICEAHGWSERSVIAHAEWQPGKIDPRGPGYPGHDGMRTLVREVMEGDDDMPTADEVADAVVRKLIAAGGVLETSDLDRIWNRDIIPAARPPHNNADYETNPTWAAKYALQTIAEATRATKAAVESLELTGLTPEQVARIAAEVSATVAPAVAEELARRMQA